MASWQESVDLVIVGSGGGGLAAAMASAEFGLVPLVLEKQAVLGGSTAMSGGVIWLPNNPLMRSAGVPDSDADGLAYLDAVVGDAGPASSLARREAFLAEGSAMVELLLNKGVRLEVCNGYSDYYDDRKGGKPGGRSIEGRPFDARKLGEWHDRIMPGMAKGIGLAVKTNEVRSIQYYNRTLGCFAVAAGVWLRTQAARLRNQELLTNGASLVAQMVQVLLAQGVQLRTGTSLAELIVEGGRVTGVRAVANGGETLIEARRGVLLAAGGFARNAEMRRKYSGSQPNEAQWTRANQGDTGEALQAAMGLGAQTALLDEAWWLPSTVTELGSSTLALARQRPGSIFVNRAGRRFCNESNSYVEVGKAMYANDAVPTWLIFDDGYRRRYGAARGRPGHLPKEWIDQGFIQKADSVQALAQKIGVDVAALAAEIEQFNIDAARGTDPRFGRGHSAYNRCLGDPGHKPNPALGPLDRGPFYATRIFPGDVGTCGGLLTDERARVIGDNGQPIAGLYATGNNTATVMGRTYPGAGASIANTMAFGFAAARHAATGA